MLLAEAERVKTSAWNAASKQTVQACVVVQPNKWKNVNLISILKSLFSWWLCTRIFFYSSH